MHLIPITKRYDWSRLIDQHDTQRNFGTAHSMATLTTLRMSAALRRVFSTVQPGFHWQNTKQNITDNNSVVKEITQDYLVKVLSSRVYEVATETKTSHAANLSAFLKNDVYLKREDTQPVFSFKIRGAYNKIASLTKEQLSKGVVTCSAGNHAQGVALSATKMGVRATIVMPEATPLIKVNAVKRFGGDTVTVLLHGSNYDEAAAEAKRLVVEQGLTMVHPFDDPYVIAGQGTIGMEVLKVRIGRRGSDMRTALRPLFTLCCICDAYARTQALQGKDIDSIFLSCGGGGMLAGVAAFVKALRPEVKVIGVEADDAAGA
jgi:threonine dehydratase